MKLNAFLAAALCGAFGAAHAATTVADAWVRGTVPQQQASGAFMRITSAEGGKLVAVSCRRARPSNSSPAATTSC